MNSLPNALDVSGRESGYVPDISVVSPGDIGMAAALYIEAGLSVLPVAIGKHPGSIVGSNWPSKSSREAKTVCDWWTAHPDAGIAIHTGASGITAFDLDIDAETLPSELEWLDAGRFQSSRGGIGVRGHYVFHTGTEVFTSGDLKLSDGRTVGDVRSGNSVILVDPSPHPKSHQGGEYQWRANDAGEPFPPLPEAARAYLRPLGTLTARGGLAAADAAVSAALADWTGCERPKALDNLTGSIRRARSGTRSRTLNALRIAACESRLGFYPLADAVERIKVAAIDSYTARGESFEAHMGGHEFGRLIGNGVGYASSRTLADIDAEARRLYGTRHTDNVIAFPSKAGITVPTGEKHCKSIEMEFWESSDQLRDLHQFARARMVGPWAMLGNVLARVVAHIPPHVVLPPTIGSHASLNIFVALVGRSGDTKSVSMSAAGNWVKIEPDYQPCKPGSGEGLAKCFAYRTKMPNNGGWTQVGKQWSVLAKLPEVDTLTASAARGGATIMSTLREGWSGERIGTDYAGEDKQIVLHANRYRLCLVMGVQPNRSRALFDDADGGTPQRFLWLPSDDPDMPDSEPDEPPVLDLGRWERANPMANLVGDVDLIRNGQLGDVADPADFDVLAIPDSARDQIKATRRAVARGDRSVNPLDGHKLLVRLKVAAALMALEGRRKTITESDWERAGTVMAVSDRTRKQVIEKLQAQRSEENEARGRFEGERADVAEQTRAERAIHRVSENIVRILRTKFDGSAARAELRTKVAYRDREHYDDAETYLVEAQRIEKARSDNHGPDGFVLTLRDDTASK
ncbi:hypothetical protein E4P42_00405 [Mycobacterium sp. PS03-16]|uniref:bifunctional DNA primase/polymerase n=1 Tax=Mycobacterium sp. PS03-16 TaxID=2559611 RepID=UPI001073CE0D|nr:bifunctional DNA primase/polymerase [Mycobacterium sp. PS03-16]TFV61398.1 hypothetical protein E4P42_00405 [Mycobacterium sp. PS03-16]